MAAPRFSKKTVIQASKNQVSSNLGDEAVILNHDKGVYYGLNSTGAYVWNLIQKPKRFEDICEALVKEYDIEPKRSERDVTKILSDMLKQGLIETKDGR